MNRKYLLMVVVIALCSAFLVGCDDSSSKSMTNKQVQQMHQWEADNAKRAWDNAPAK